MDNQSYRQIIYYEADKGRKPKEIFENFVATYGRDQAPSYSTVTRWFNEWRWDRKDLANRPSTGRPVEAITSGKVDAARRIVARDAG